MRLPLVIDEALAFAARHPVGHLDEATRRRLLTQLTSERAGTIVLADATGALATICALQHARKPSNESANDRRDELAQRERRDRGTGLRSALTPSSFGLASPTRARRFVCVPPQGRGLLVEAMSARLERGPGAREHLEVRRRAVLRSRC
jgi:hypothetical protein